MRITLGKKIFGGFFIILLLLAVGSMISSNRIHFTDETYKGLINENVESAMLAKNLQVLYLGESNAIKNYLLTGHEAYISQYDDYLLKANETIKEMLKIISS